MIQVKLYEDKRLQGFDYQGLPPKQIPFVKHYLLSDLQKQKAISNNSLLNKFNNQVWHLLQQEYSMRAGVVELRISP
ncbi:hypothetical protein [Nostoc sp. DedQUE07]|uniref:hypothetical protein n=1 Tax=Nostoc sp. DedQUE07 TaxID=3075392 RepID=UPI002AD29879|nr:hypothetical protein [Nostoc sp. DedQUE07]MDZ8132067.1 hypothetical protein [Nostoc sp. DedQUE07]